MASGKITFTLEWVSEDGDFFAVKVEEGYHKAGRNMKPHSFRRGENVHIQDHESGCFPFTGLAILTRDSLWWKWRRERRARGALLERREAGATRVQGPVLGRSP